MCEDVIGKSRWTYGHSSSSESSNDEEDDDNCFDFFSKDYMTSQPSFSLEPTIKDPSGVQYSQTPLSKKKSNGSQQRGVWEYCTPGGSLIVGSSDNEDWDVI